MALTLGAVPDGTGQIWLDNVQCRGTETRLIDCPANAIGTHNCAHSEDAGVSCAGNDVIKEYCTLIIELSICSCLHPRSHQTSRRH